jgi:hypothetical protein
MQCIDRLGDRINWGANSPVEEWQMVERANIVEPLLRTSWLGHKLTKELVAVTLFNYGPINGKFDAYVCAC